MFLINLWILKERKNLILTKNKFKKMNSYTSDQWRNIHSGTAKQMHYLNDHIESMEKTYERHMKKGEHMLK